MNKIFTNNIGHLGQIQHANFYRFLYKGIAEELKIITNPFPIKKKYKIIKKKYRKLIRKQNILIFFSLENCIISNSFFNVTKIIKEDLTYSVLVFLPIQYSYTNNRESTKKDISMILVKQYISLGEIPLMTDEGTFIVNGCERIVISQIIKSPGIYFKKDLSLINKIIYTATIISNNGLWSQMLYKNFPEKKEKVYYKESLILKKSQEEVLDNFFIYIDEYDFHNELRNFFYEFSNLEKKIEEIHNLQTQITEKDTKINKLETIEIIYLHLNKKEESFKYDNFNPQMWEENYLKGPGREKETDLTMFYEAYKNVSKKLDLQKYKKFCEFLDINNKDSENDEICTEIFYLTKYPKLLDEFIIAGGNIRNVHITELLKFNKPAVYYKNFENFYEESFPKKILTTEKKDKLKIHYIKYLKILFESTILPFFYIGELGRYKINNQLEISVPKEMTFLTISDFAGIFDGLMELKYGYRTNDHIDHISNKKIRSVGELFQRSIHLCFLKNIKDPKKQLLHKKWIDSFNFLVKTSVKGFYLNIIFLNAEFLIETLYNFLIGSPLSQYMDETNPVSNTTHKRRISVFGPNGLKRGYHLPISIRDIRISQYGKLCYLETPEGKNAGLVSALSTYAKISSSGWLETPYFLIKDSTLFSQKSPIFLNSEEESSLNISFCDNSIDKKNKIIEPYLSVKDDSSFSVEKTKDVSFFTTSALQLISIATTLVPFIEHNDATRALMGANMQRQAVCLISSQKAIVGTGFEFITVLNSDLVIKCYNEGKILRSNSSYILISDFAKQKIKYYLIKYQQSNQKLSRIQRPLVWSNENVFSGQIIADGGSTNDGELALGKNLTVAYMPWEGYNFEDAIIINEKLVREESLTSLHILKEEIEFPSVKYQIDIEGSIESSNMFYNLIPYSIKKNYRKNGIINVGVYVNKQDILIESTNKKAIDISNLKISKEPFYLSKDIEGRVINVNSHISSNDKIDIISIIIAFKRKIKVGDKLAGRHGNKGVISRILSTEDMPFLPDGIPIDVILNPLGVPSRMNVGQVFESLLGLAGQYLGSRFKVSAFDEIYGSEASRILVNQKLKEAALKTRLSWLFNPISPGKILLRDGRTGEYFDNPITVGKSYILKLIHVVDDKINSRSTGPYSRDSEQPVHGKSIKGGQRFGEMEVWALEAYGATNILQELLTIKADDIDARNAFKNNSLKKKNTINSFVSEGFLRLLTELKALGLDFTLRNSNFFTNNINFFTNDIFKTVEIRLQLKQVFNQVNTDLFLPN